MTDNSLNKYVKYQRIAYEISKNFHNTPNLVGIIWIGSSSYGIYDEMADIDIQLITTNKDDEFSMKQFKKEGVKIEVDMTDIKWLLQKSEPDSEQFWIREKAKILYDPQKILKKKFNDLNRIDKKVYEKILWNLYKDIFHSYDFEKSMKRGEKIISWMYLFKTINALSKFAFIYNEKPVPTFKWRWYFIEKEGLLSEDLIKKIRHFSIGNEVMILCLIKDIEEYAQKQMLKKGYSTYQVKEPWLF